jgi:hypothetical protein
MSNVSWSLIVSIISSSGSQVGEGEMPRGWNVDEPEQELPTPECAIKPLSLFLASCSLPYRDRMAQV